MELMYFVGYDVGSEFVHSVAVDRENRIISAPKSIMHFGNPVSAIEQIAKENKKKGINEKNSTFAFTGSGGKIFADATKAEYFYDSLTIPIGAHFISPEAKYVFHIGSKDPYFFEKSKTGESKVYIPDFGTGTKCGGGSGILLNKQCRRLFAGEAGDKGNQQEMMEKMYCLAFKNALKSDKNIDVGGRCGVVIQSDMIHLQNSGENIANILQGLFERIAKNYRADVVRVRTLDSSSKAVITGGVAFNELIIKSLEKILKIKIERPVNFEKVAAMGVALKLKENAIKKKPDISRIDKVREIERKSINYTFPISDYLKYVNSIKDDKSIKAGNLEIFYEGDEEIECVMGVDGGSTTTKAVILKKSNLEPVCEICIETHGRPLNAAQKIFKEIKDYFKGRLKISAVAYTGSSGAFYYKIFTKNLNQDSADLVIDEITCHALGVKKFNEKVDTIFELGGQDAKFTFFGNEGEVKKAKMNLSCMAGTGQTMQNMIKMIGLDFEEFEKLALKAKRTPLVDETCGVFTEAGISKLASLGLPKEEVAAAIAYGFIGGYINKFVGNEKFGEFISAQGGPFKNLACLSALAAHIKKEVHAFPHRQLFGAYGAALAAYQKLISGDIKTNFKGLEVSEMDFARKKEKCSKIIKDNCGVRDCTLEAYCLGNDIILSGGLCPKGNSEINSKKAPDYVLMYKDILNKHLARFTKKIEDSISNKRIFIPRSLTFLNEKGVFYCSLYSNLGFEVIISPESDENISNLGKAFSHSEFCYPLILAHGHAAFLKQKMREGDKLLLADAISEYKEKYKFCPYAASSGNIIMGNLNLEKKDVLLPILYFDDEENPIHKAVYSDLKRVFKDREISEKEVLKAVKKAEEDQKLFSEEVFSKGNEILKSLEVKEEKAFIGIGRGYTLFDPKASSNVNSLFCENGLHFIPAQFVDTSKYDSDKIVENMYWNQGRKILEKTAFSFENKRLFPVRLTNFNCGPDSILHFHEEKLANYFDKPWLVLETDGHNSNAQFGTRIRAHNRVVEVNLIKSSQKELNPLKIKSQNHRGRLIGIPYMGDSSYIMCAAMKSLDLKAEVMPTKTREADEIAKKLVNANTCQPFFFQIGEQIAWLESYKKKGRDPNKELAIFMPRAKGPCRFGQYYVVLKRFFEERGFEGVVLLNPSSTNDYADVDLPKKSILILTQLFFKGVVANELLRSCLLRTRPYEIKKGESDKAYEKAHNQLLKLIEKNPNVKNISKFLKQKLQEFKKIEREDKNRFPLVLMNGEIFVRSHELSNQDSIKMLEAHKLEVVLEPIFSWLMYTNKNMIKRSVKLGKFSKAFSSFLKRWYLQSVIKALTKPFLDYLAGRENHDPNHLIEFIEKEMIYNSAIEGESCISIGGAHAFIENKMNIDGIYHVGPLGCMQETIATSRIHALIHKKREKEAEVIPFMDAVFGDSPIANLDSQIAIFAENCRIKKEMRDKKS